MILQIKRQVGAAVETRNVEIDNKTQRIQKLMEDDKVTVQIVTDHALDLQINDWIEFDGDKYYLNRPSEPTKVSNVEYHYSITFEGNIYKLHNKTYRLNGASKFHLVGTLDDFVNLLLENINTINPGWTKGSIYGTERKNIYFESISCRSVLSKLANEFGVEFYLSGKQINFVEKFETPTALTFEVGKGKGLYKLNRKNVDSENTVTRAYVFGGDKNLPLDYRKTDNNGIPLKNLVFQERFLEDTTEHSEIVEKDVYFEDVFPRFLGTVESVSGADHEKIICSAIDFDINEQLLSGLTAKINFLTGDLMGKQYEIEEYNHTTKEVTLIPADDGTGMVFPNANFYPKVGDKFNFLDIEMPQTYIDNAEAELRTKGQKWLSYNKQLRVKYDLFLDNRYLRQQNKSLKVGDLVRIKDIDLGIDKLLRIISITQNVEDPYNIKCEVSNYLEESWEKEITARISATNASVVLQKTEQLYDLNITRGWIERNFAKVVGDNTYLGKQTINGDIDLYGNLNQYGELKKIIAEHVYVKDEFVNLRDGATVAIGPGMLSGFNIAKYDGVNNLLFGAGNDGVGRIGHEGGELQALLTREDSPARGLLWFDETTKKAMGCGILTSDLHLANWDEAFENMGKIYSTSYGSYYDFSVAAGGIDYAASATYIRVQGNDGRYYNPRTMEADNSMLLQGHNASYFAKRNGDAGENFNMSIAQCFYEDGAKRTVINEGKIYNIAADGSVAHSLYLNLGKTIVAHHNGTIQAPIGQFGNILIHNNNEINTDATGFWLNYRNGDGSVTNYKSLIIGNGKNNSIATFYGESKLAKFYGDIQSDNYATNAGFKLTQAGYGELQHLRVNGSFTCVDLIAEKKRAVNGGLRICKASGKIKEVHRENDTSTLWIVTLENENQFAVNDWVICQYYNGGNSNRYYRAKVVWVDSQNRYFALSDFNDETRPADGDDIIADNGHYIDLVSTENGEQRQYITFVNNNHNYLHLGKLNTYGLGGDAYGIASKDTSGNTIFQLGSTNQITGFNFTSKYLNKGTGSSSNDFGLIISTENVLEDTSGIIYNHCRKLAGYSLTWHKDSNAGHIVMGQLASNANTLKAGFMGIQMMNHLGQEFFALSAKTDKVGATEYYCKIAGCNYNHKNIWTDGWKLMYDGSGNLAKGNISWDINGNVTFTENVKMQWQTGVVHDAQFEYGLDYWGTGWEGLLLPKLTKGNVNPNNNVYSTPARQVDMYSRKPVPVDVNKTYKMRIRVKTNNVAAMGRMYAGVATLDANYNNLTGGAGTHRYFCVSSLVLPDTQWHEYEGIIQGVGDNSHNFRTGTKYVRPLLLLNFGGGTSIMDIDYCTFEEVGVSSWTTTITNSTIQTTNVIAQNLQVNMANILGELNASRLTAGSITTSKLAATCITADKIAAGAITADKLHANAITADRINALHITALGAVTAATFALGNGNFNVDALGNLAAKNAVIEGIIKATTGNMGNWLLTGDKLSSVNGKLIFDSFNELIQFQGTNRTLAIKKGVLTPLSTSTSTPVPSQYGTKSTGAVPLTANETRTYTFVLSSSFTLTAGKKYEVDVRDVAMYAELSCRNEAEATFSAKFVVRKLTGEYVTSVDYFTYSALLPPAPNELAYDEFTRSMWDRKALFEVESTSTYKLELVLEIHASIAGYSGVIDNLNVGNFSVTYGYVSINSVLNFAELSPDGFQFINSATKYVRTDINATNVLEIGGDVKFKDDLSIGGNLALTGTINNIRFVKGSFTSSVDGNQFVSVPGLTVCCGAVVGVNASADYGCGRLGETWGGKSGTSVGFWFNRDNAHDNSFTCYYVAFGY